MTTLYEHWFPSVHHVFPDKLKVLFLAKLVQALGSNLIAFFLPIFIFRSFSEQTIWAISNLTNFQLGMVGMGMFYLLQRLVVLLSTFPIVKFIAKIGVRNALILGELLNVVTLSLYYFSSGSIWFLLIAIIVEGLRIPLFWISFFTLFSSYAKYEKMGTSVGTLEFFTRLMQVGVPMLAGLIIATAGFAKLFILGIFFHLTAVVVLLLLDQELLLVAPSLQELKNWWEEKQFKLLAVSFVGKYFADSLQFLWPFFVFLLIGSVDQVGFLYSFVFFLTLVIVYFAGWLVDHRKSTKPMTLSGMMLGGVWVVRAFTTTTWGLIGVDTVDRLLQSVFIPFYESLLIRRSKGSRVLSYFTYREFIISLAGVIFWLLFTLYFFFYSTWQNFILIGVLAMLASIQLRDKEIKNQQP